MTSRRSVVKTEAWDCPSETCLLEPVLTHISDTFFEKKTSVDIRPNVIRIKSMSSTIIVFEILWTFFMNEKRRQKPKK